MTAKKHILIADDDRAIIASLRLLLTNHGYEITHANTPQEAIYLAEQSRPDLVLLDMNYSRDTTSGQEGMDLLQKLRATDESLPVVVMTGWATVDLAVSAMKYGAGDFIQKPWDNHRLLSILRVQLQLLETTRQQQKLTRQNQILKDDLNAQSTPLIAESASMRTLIAQAKKAANSEVSILITGENGTGKNMLAEYIHQCSNRSRLPFISVNMGAIPDSLFESELFGHAKGAFTDAKTRRIGRIELAEGGTLFLDEIGNLPLAQQSKLLHLLEQKQYEVVGQSQTHHADIRVITATNEDLVAQVRDKQFRMDLLYRLNTVTLLLPPLRERREDILPLAEAFCVKFSAKYQKSDLSLSANANAALSNYHWPGNIRELSHVIERAVIFTEHKQINAADLMLQESAPEIPQTESMQSMAELEKDTITQRLNHFKGNANLAADSLGLSRSAFYRRMDKYKI